MHLRTLSLQVLLIVAVGLGGTRILEASNWPRFRGPNGTGISTDKGVPVTWDAQGILWKAAIAGSGNSSPIVWDGRVFLQTASPDGKMRKLLCLDLNDGKTLWEQSAPGTIARTHKKNTLASCTVATDGARVYTPFWDGETLSISAYDFAGKLAWTKSLGEFKAQHGAGHSPALYDGKVILCNDQDGSAYLVALKADTGDIAWKAQRPVGKACYSTPFVLERPGTAPEVVVASTAGIAGYDPKTGREDWNWNWTGHGLRTVGSPIFDQGMIFVSSGDGAGNRHAVAVKVDGTGNSTSTSLAWEETRTFPYVPTMLSRGEHLYFVNDRGVAACHVAKTGEKVWTERLGGDFTASPVMIDGKVYAVNESGDVYVFAAEPAFKLLAKNSIGEHVLSSPAVADNRLLIRGSEHLFCIGKPTAK